MTMPLTIPPGHAGLLHSKIATSLDTLEAHIAVLGIPYGHAYSLEDLTNNDQPSAPTAVRQASERAVGPLDRFDFDVGGTLFDGKSVDFVDCGDVPGNLWDHTDHFARAETAVRKILAAGA